jgi:hypothetical protein
MNAISHGTGRQKQRMAPQLRTYGTAAGSANAAPIGPIRALSDMELDQVAAAGGSKGGGLGSGGGGSGVMSPPRLDRVASLA